jgi:uncharacterized surface protein with fasciclin (FAS1) repeats
MNTKYWGWGLAVLAVILIVAAWMWGRSHNTSTLQAVDYGAPAASSTDALSGPTVPVVAENRSSSTVMGIIGGLQNESRFAALLANTGVSGSLTGKGPYTVFVPTDASFGQLPPGTMSAMTSAQLKRLVQYHIVSGRSIDVNAQVAGTIQALSKDMLNFSKNTGDKSARVNSAVAIRSYKASNGIVYVISGVLLPPLAPQQ